MSCVVTPGLLLLSNNPTLADGLARSAVRAEIGQEVSVIPYEDFRKRELPRILAELQLDPAELGIELEPKSNNPEP